MAKKYIITLLFVTFLCQYSISFANQTPKYVGARKCKSCHSDQFRIWSESRHAIAFKMLGSEKAKQIAKSSKMIGDVHEAAACLKCHVTGYGEPDNNFTASYNKTEGITCEACHGPGSLYLKAMAKDKRKYGSDPETTVGGWIKLGLIKPVKATCLSCHGHFGKEFDFTKMVKKIAH